MPAFCRGCVCVCDRDATGRFSSMPDASISKNVEALACRTLETSAAACSGAGAEPRHTLPGCRHPCVSAASRLARPFCTRPPDFWERILWASYYSLLFSSALFRHRQSRGDTTMVMMMMMIFIGTQFCNLHRDANGLHLRQTSVRPTLRKNKNVASSIRASSHVV